MKEKDLIKQLEELKNIKPREDWKNTTREILFAEIKKDAVDVRRQKRSFVRIYIEMTLSVLREKTMQPASSLLIMLGLVFGSSMVVNSAFYSLPGQKLYNVKLALEQTKLAMVRDDRAASEFKIELVQRRVDELDKVVSQKNTPSVKKERVGKAIKQFQKEVASVKNYVSGLESDFNNKDLDIVFNMAVSVDSAATQLKDELPEETQALEGIGKDVLEALSMKVQSRIDTLNEKNTKLESENKGNEDILGVSKKIKESLDTAQGLLDTGDLENALEYMDAAATAFPSNETPQLEEKDPEEKVLGEEVTPNDNTNEVINKEKEVISGQKDTAESQQVKEVEEK